MSEWVDFGLYSLQAVLLWIVLPRWGLRFLQPATASRAFARGARPRSSGWIHFLRAWGMLSVLVLLAYRLGMVPPPLSASALHRTGWEALLMTSNLLLALGLLFGGFALWRLLGWLKAHATPEARPEEAFPLTRDDFLPRGVQHLVHALLLCALLARPLAALAWPGRLHDIWGNFFTGLVIALLLYFAAAGSVLRAPHQLDLALGDRCRRLEVCLCYLLMGNLALLELGALALEVSGLGSHRHVALLVSGFVSVTLVGLMGLSSLRPRPALSEPFQIDP